MNDSKLAAINHMLLKALVKAKKLFLREQYGLAVEIDDANLSLRQEDAVLDIAEQLEIGSASNDDN